MSPGPVVEADAPKPEVADLISSTEEETQQKLKVFLYHVSTYVRFLYVVRHFFYVSVQLEDEPVVEDVKEDDEDEEDDDDDEDDDKEDGTPGATFLFSPINCAFFFFFFYLENITY